MARRPLHAGEVDAGDGRRTGRLTPVSVVATADDLSRAKAALAREIALAKAEAATVPPYRHVEVDW